jgi:uncharacterized protein (TIGR00369 family)
MQRRASRGLRDWAKLSRMELTQLQDALATYFAPWVQALDLRVEHADGDGVQLRLPQQAQLARTGGMVCGQAMMAAADTCMVLALMQHWGEFKPCTTVQMNTSFLKPLAGQDGLVQARLLRVGKSLAFGEIDIRGANDQRSVCRSTTTYALL